MSFALAFVLAAAAVQTPLAANPQQHGTVVAARATAEILRPVTNSEAGAPGEVKRHVSRPEPGRVTIAFE